MVTQLRCPIQLAGYRDSYSYGHEINGHSIVWQERHGHSVRQDRDGQLIGQTEMLIQ